MAKHRRYKYEIRRAQTEQKVHGFFAFPPESAHMTDKCLTLSTMNPISRPALP